MFIFISHLLDFGLEGTSVPSPEYPPAGAFKRRHGLKAVPKEEG